MSNFEKKKMQIFFNDVKLYFTKNNNENFSLNIGLPPSPNPKPTYFLVWNFPKLAILVGKKMKQVVQLQGKM